MIISISLGLFILSVLLEMFVTNQKSVKLQAALYNIQDNAKTAISILTDEIHQAGIMGCARLSIGFPVTSFREYSFNRANRLVATSANEIMVRYAKYPNASLEESMQNEMIIHANKTDHFAAGDILLISDCKQAEIFQAANVRVKNGMQEITASMPLHNKYEKFSEISHFIVNKFSITKTNRTHPDGSHVYSLFIEDINRNKIELVQGINQMSMLFTINEAGEWRDVKQYEVNDWAQVAGVAIDLDVSEQAMKKTWHMYAVLNG